jgi:hypothetical protein
MVTHKVVKGCQGSKAIWSRLWLIKEFAKGFSDLSSWFSRSKISPRKVLADAKECD